ncbi:MAG: copper amine oxidase N-terminal domain-containing protein [Defluviitaleaceae bacterium]|nr:copper amine oxidase N-terminal domain-containing protein [Defluviitaleaceae bacterium]
MIPLRAIAEGLGADVDWNEATRTVSITRNGQTAFVTIDMPLPDGMGVAVIEGGRTFVPARYVSEILGAQVRWDDASRAVYIY